MKHKLIKQSGVSLIELLIVMAIITTTLVALLAVLNYSLKIMQSQRTIQRANFLAQQATEGIRNFRDNTDWSVNGLGSLVMGNAYHLVQQGAPPNWALLSGEQTIDGFTEKIVFVNGQRDVSDNIVGSGGAVDADTKKATVTVEWTENGQLKQIILVAYFTNWQ